MRKSFWYKQEFMKILPKSVIFGSYWRNDNGSNQTNISSLSNLKKKKYVGDLSKKSRVRIERSIEALCIQTGWKSTYCKIEKKDFRYRIGFVTLTLPATQRHSDEDIKQICLGDFLTKLRNNHQCINYIWKAESQKNGNIHFHITVDKYIHYSVIRKYWLASLEKLGYITAYAITKKNYYPPCSEIKSVRSVKNIGAYLAKYISKKSDNRLISGRIWNSSYNLSRYKFPALPLGHDYFSAIYDCAIDFCLSTHKSEHFESLEVDILTIMRNVSLEVRSFLEDCFKCSFSDLNERLVLKSS